MRHTDTISGLLLLALSGLLYWLNSGYPREAAVYPRWLLSVMAICAVIMVTHSITTGFKGRSNESRSSGAIHSPEPHTTVSGDAFRSSHLKRVLTVGVAACLYAVALSYLGFLASTPLVLAVLIWSLGTRRWTVILSTALTLTFGVYVVFNVFLGIRLPTGFWVG